MYRTRLLAGPADPSDFSTRMTDSSALEVADAPGKARLGIWQLAWPAMVGNLLYSVIGIISIKIVGELGASAVAAVTTGQRLFFALQAIMMAISTGTTAMVARAYGAGDHMEAARVTSVSLWIGNVIALGLTLPCILFAHDIAGVFGLDARTTSEATSYIRWLSLFNVAFAINIIISTALRAAGDTRTPLWIGSGTNVVNVALLYLLVFGGFGVPAMGIAGAAIANGVSFTLAAAIFLYMWYAGRLVVGVGGPGSMTRKRVRQLVHIGYPAGIEQFIFQGGFIAFLWLVGFYGTDAFAAYGIGVQILSVSFVAGFGFSVAGATLVGQHLGAGDPEGATRQGWRSAIFAICAMTMLSLIIVIEPDKIARFLISDDKVVKLTVSFIYIMALAQPLMAVDFSIGGCLRGSGDTRFPLFCTMSGLLIVRVGLAALFTWMSLPVVWVYGALLGDYLVKASLEIWRFRTGRWRQIFTDAETRFAAYED